MLLSEIFDPHEKEHFDDLEKTGFYGKAGAGCIVLAKSTNRILLCHRSAYVEQPNTWGNWGGALNPGEDPKEGAVREATEELGISGFSEIHPLYVFSSGTFRYYNFIIVVQDEFTPNMNWESQGHQWCDWGDWPKPLHFGLISLFNDQTSVDRIQSLFV